MRDKKTQGREKGYQENDNDFHGKKGQDLPGDILDTLLA